LVDRSRHLRRLIFRAIENGGRGHIGPALSLVEIIRVLYDDFLRHDPAKPAWRERDRFILSKGHGCLALYAVLADKGFFDLGELDRFCHFDSFLGGHPETVVPGVEACTGALGHGLSIGLGMALAARMTGRDSKVYVLMGDGEINEGSVWEAAACADKHRLSNLTAIIDYNKIQSAGSVFEIQNMEPLADKWTAFGFRVFECNGHDVDDLRQVFRDAAAYAGDRPRAVICHTVKGKGIPAAENNPDWHHKSDLKPAELQIVRSALGAEGEAERCASVVSTWSTRSAKRDERVVFIGSDLSPNLLGEMKKEFPAALLHGGHRRGQHHRHGRRHGDGRVHPLRQHDRHLHHAALLRAGRGRSLPARPAGAADRQRRRLRLRAARARRTRRSRTSPSCAPCRA
jgi:transketolase